MTIDCTVTLGEQPDPHADLARLERELAGMPKLLEVARRVGDSETLRHFRDREVALADEIFIARRRVAEAARDAALERVNLAESTVEPARVESIKAGSAFESARDEYARRKHANDAAMSAHRVAQEAVMSARVALAAAEDALARLLDEDAPSPTLPAAAQPHSEVDPATVPRRALDAWDRR